ncbi:hypothetical protein Tco_1311961 [Tanacetum coccineum]
MEQMTTLRDLVGFKLYKEGEEANCGEKAVLMIILEDFHLLRCSRMGLAHIISPPEYDHFCFKIEPELGNLTMDVVNDIFPTREPRVHVPNVLPTHLTLDTDFILLSESLKLILYGSFLPFLTYRIFTKRQKSRPNRTKPNTDLERARKTEAKGTKGLKTEPKRKFPDRLDNACTFNEVKTKSKSTPGYGIGKSSEKRTRNPIMIKWADPTPWFRPVVGSRPSFKEPGNNEPKYFGHFAVGRRQWKNAGSTSHYAQPNTITFDMAMEWQALQKKSELCWDALFEQHSKEQADLKALLKDPPVKKI